MGSPSHGLRRSSHGSRPSLYRPHAGSAKVELLRRLSLSVSVDDTSTRDVSHYTLEAMYVASPSSGSKDWDAVLESSSSAEVFSYSMPLKDYARFREKMLDSLHFGHKCANDRCLGLYTFLESSFPSSIISVLPSRHTREKKRNTKLQKYFSTLHHFLLDANHHRDCPHIAKDVTDAFLKFLLGDRYSTLLADASGSNNNLSFQTNESEGVTKSFSSSSSELLDDPLDDITSKADTSCGICGNDDVSGGKTALDCGHHFHDECLVEKLNEALECPTCHASLQD